MAMMVVLMAQGAGFAQYCATEQYFAMHEEAAVAQRASLEAFTQQWLRENIEGPSARSTVVIPVVVHVVWKRPEEQVEDEQIQAQIAVLNRDFRSKNAEIPNVPAVFRAAIADVEIEFCLASRDPQGNPTKGITRTRTSVDQFNNIRAICYGNSGGHDAWNPDHYLNIWVGNLGGAFLGEASFPGVGPATEDGVRLDYRAFGVRSAVNNPRYNLGRTATHEIGHYFNLLHPWGRGIDPSCNDDDEVSDTPRQSSTFRNECPVHPQVFCGTASMFMNFMNFTDDACMGMFTRGQKARMMAALNGPRARLLNSPGCQPPVSVHHPDPPTTFFRLAQNPVGSEIRLEAVAGWPKPCLIRCANAQGQQLWLDRWDGRAAYTRSVIDLPNGIYFLILQYETNIFSQKIVVVH